MNEKMSADRMLIITTIHRVEINARGSFCSAGKIVLFICFLP